MKRAAILLLFALPAFAAEPSKFTLPLGSAADPLTVLGPALACADNQVARFEGASATQLQCSVLTVADTTGTITGPAGGFSIIGGTGATDDLILDGSAGTAGSVTVTEGGLVISYGGFFVDDLIGGDYQAALFRDPRGYGSIFLNPYGRLVSGSANKIAARNASTAQGLEIYGTADANSDSFANYERLSLSCDGTADCTIATETAGTGTDDVVLTVKGEGPAGTLVLDGSDDVAGSVSISAAGRITAAEIVSTGKVEASGQLSIAGTIYAIGGIVGLVDTGEVAWSSTAATTGAKDTGLVRSAAGVVKVTDGSTGIGKLLNARVVTPDIDGETTTAVQSGTVWTNTGDGDGEAVTLLNDPGIGVQYCFAVDAAQTITVAPSTGESLYYGTDQCVVSLTSNSIGSTLCVTAITGGSGAKWFTISDTGSWTCND